MNKLENAGFYPPQEIKKTELMEAPGLEREEMEFIVSRANLRRRQFEFKKSISEMGDMAKDKSFSVILQTVYEEMGGAAPAGLPEELIAEASSWRRKAESAAISFPNQAAYLYAKAARAELAGNGEAEEDIVNAREYLSKSKDAVKTNPSHLLPEAAMIGIEKMLSESSPAPSQEEVARASGKNDDLLREYALILSEMEREKFLSLLPGERRRAASVILDHSVSEYLPEEFSITKDEQEQRRAVLARSAKNLEQAVTESKPRADVDLLCETLSRLRGADGARSLAEAGALGLAGLKDKKQQALRYEYAGKITRALLEQDAGKGGMLAMKFLGKNDLPEDQFRGLFESLLEKKIFTAKAEKYFTDEDNWQFLKQLIAQYPNQFNTVIDTLSELRDYNPAENEGEVFQALQDLDSITPIIFDRYRRADAKGKKELAEKIRELKPKFFRNQPIGDILPREDRKILAEMVYLAYQPVGMSFRDVETFLGRLHDHTEDLAEFNFPENGYPFVMEGGKRYVLKPGESLDNEKLRTYRELFTGKTPQTDEKIATFSKFLERIAKAGSDFKAEELPALLGILTGDQAARNFLERSKDLAPANYFTYLNELKELLGVYFTDNYPERLANFLSANPKVEGRIIKILSSPERAATLKKKLAKSGEEVDWEKIASREEAAKALSAFVQDKVLKKAREEIAKMANKFMESEVGEEAQGGRAGLKAYVSKNIGSFFAKASAGICTAQDIELFNREDHFHINIVEGDEAVRGNIQAYIIDEPDGGKSLILRGFNPNMTFLNKINPGSFCEAVLKVARQFQKDNKLEHVYITEHLSGWHALSNREAVAQYLQKKYVKEKTRRNFHLPISSSQSVNFIYEV